MTEFETLARARDLLDDLTAEARNWRTTIQEPAPAHASQDAVSVIDSIREQLKKGERQAEVRDQIIDTINGLADALQGATDYVSRLISEALLDLADLAPEHHAHLSFRRRFAARIAEVWQIVPRSEPASSLIQPT